MKLKIGKGTYLVKKGDFITFDGEIYKYYTGDLRVLKVKGDEHFCYLPLPPTTFNKIPSNLLRKKRDTGKVTYWYFK